LCRQLRKVQVAEGGGQDERVMGGLGEEFGRALPLAAVAGGQVNLQLDQRSVDALARGPVAGGVPQLHS